MKTYNLLYKVGYKHSNLWTYSKFTIEADSLVSAKRKARKSHPKATKFEFVEVIK